MTEKDGKKFKSLNDSQQQRLKIIEELESEMTNLTAMQESLIKQKQTQLQELFASNIFEFIQVSNTDKDVLRKKINDNILNNKQYFYIIEGTIKRIPIGF